MIIGQFCVTTFNSGMNMDPSMFQPGMRFVCTNASEYLSSVFTCIYVFAFRPPMARFQPPGPQRGPYGLEYVQVIALKYTKRIHSCFYLSCLFHV
jgi:hypothetical protein